MGIVTKIINKNFLAKSIRKITFSSVQTVDSISAVFAQGSQVIYSSASLDSLKSSLTVTANYDDGTSGVVTGYTLSGTLTEGTSVVTVTYEGKTTTFNVTVSHLVVLDSITAVYNQSDAVYVNTPLDTLKQDLTVTANYDDGTHSNVIGADYNLSGELSVGTSIITVSYGGKTTTFNVNVSTGTLEVTSIDAVYTQGATAVYAETPLNNLKENLVVTATYTGGTTSIINANDYTLSGTLVVGTSTITVTYEGETDTFDVLVSSAPELPVEYQQVEYLYKTTANSDTINTEAQVVPATDAVEIEFEQTAHQSSNNFACPFGDWWTNINNGIYCYITKAGKAYVRCGKNVTIADELALNVKHTLSVYHDTVILDGTSIGEPDGTYASASNHGMRVFTAGNNSGDTVMADSIGYIGKIYSFKIYRNDILLHDFVPCYRKSDSKTGMYDLVAETFKASSGSTILAGPDAVTKVLSSISAVYTQGAQVVYPDTTLDTLKSNLVVTATYEDTTTETISAAKYTLSGILATGTSTVTATYKNKTATFNVTVVDRPTLTAIDATFTQGGMTVYPSTSLNSLKSNLVVTTTYSDSSTGTLGDNDYTLTGTLAVGTSTITVTYGSLTDIFDVTVSEEESIVLPLEYQQVEYISNDVLASTAGRVQLSTKFNTATDKMEVDFMPTSFSSYSSTLLGCPVGDYWNDNSKGCYSYITSSGEMTVRCGKNVKVAAASDAPLTALTANTRYILSVYHDTVLINGLSCGTPEGTYAITSQYPVWLLGTPNATTGQWQQNAAFMGRVYNYKIYTNDVLSHNFIPCYRKSDNAIGVYDVIDETFTAGTGSHLGKGADINIRELSSITATYTQGAQQIFPNSSLDDLKANLVVTANFEDGTSGIVGSNLYTLSGTLTEGTSTITATYEGKTDTFDVTVSTMPILSSITATYTQGNSIIFDSTPLNNLKKRLVVVANYSNVGTTETLTDSDYILSGTLTAGTSTITASYSGQTDTFNVNVTDSTGIETETIDYISAADIQNAIAVDKVDTFVKTLKTASIWDKLDGIYPFMANDQAGMLINLKAAGTKDLTALDTLNVTAGKSIKNRVAYPNTLTQSDLETNGFSMTIFTDNPKTSGLQWLSSCSHVASATAPGDFAMFHSKSGSDYKLLVRVGGYDGTQSDASAITTELDDYVVTGNIIYGEPNYAYIDGSLAATASVTLTTPAQYQYMLGANSPTYKINGGGNSNKWPSNMKFCAIGQALTAQEISVLSDAIRTLKSNA